MLVNERMYQSIDQLACRTGGLAGPARYTSARAKRENEGEARGQKNPPVVTPLFMLFRPLEMIDVH